MNPYQFEENLESAAVAGLLARGAPAFAGTGTQEKPQDRIDLTVGAFRRASNQMAYSASGVPFHNHFQGTLTFISIAQRAGPHNLDQKRWVAIIRQMMSRPAQFFNATNLPCYEVLRIEESDPEPEINAATDSDRTPLAFTIELGILGAHIP